MLENVGCKACTYKPHSLGSNKGLKLLQIGERNLLLARGRGRVETSEHRPSGGTALGHISTPGVSTMCQLSHQEDD